MNNVQLNTAFEIGTNEKAVIKGSPLLVEVTGISDSRCPADVQCVWAGNAKVDLKVSGLESGDKVLSFCIGQCENRYREADTVFIQQQREQYLMILSQVKPYPGTGSQKKTVVFTLQKE